MQKLLPILFVGMLVVMSGCVNIANNPNVGNVQVFKTTCEDCKCVQQGEFCATKNLVSSVVTGTDVKIQVYPTKQTTCTYYCTTPEVAEKQKLDPKNWAIRCSYMDDTNYTNNDFTFLKWLAYNEKFLSLQVSYINPSPIQIQAIEGKGDFDGSLSKQMEWDAVDNKIHLQLWRGLINTKVGERIQNGIIKFHYTKDGEEKIFDSMCKFAYLDHT